MKAQSTLNSKSIGANGAKNKNTSECHAQVEKRRSKRNRKERDEAMDWPVGRSMTSTR